MQRLNTKIRQLHADIRELQAQLEISEDKVSFFQVDYIIHIYCVFQYVNSVVFIILVSAYSMLHFKVLL